MKRARRMIGNERTDTTQSDYFRLKSIGLDPDTPSVPAVKRRRISDRSEATSEKSSRASLSAEPYPDSLRQSSAAANWPDGSASANRNDDDDELEALLAKARLLRATMAESEAWFKEEREKSERRSSDDDGSERRKETEKERRLREFQTTPSRSRLRMETSPGAQELLQRYHERKAQQEQERQARRGVKEPETDAQSSAASRVQGLAALTNGTSFSASRASAAFGGRGSGASADDAIEL
jgi:hypothetical protein